MTRVRRIHCGI